MNVLSREKRTLVIRCLVEGMSIRATARIADVAKNTVMKLVVDAGKACAEYQDRVLRDLPCQRIEVDEIWSFIYAKEGSLPRAKNAPPEAGDVWTWVAVCADTKLVPSWLVGDRTAATALEFMDDLQGRLSGRIQLTSDGFNGYIVAVDEAFGGDVDYAQLVKVYASEPTVEGARRYSPPVCQGSQRMVWYGAPDLDKISTSYVERQNLTMRMSMRRFTRLTNAFSKKVENHAHMVALHYMHYNFCRVHKTLRVTPAMEAGVTDTMWDVPDIVEVIEAATPAPGPRGPYRKRNSK